MASSQFDFQQIREMNADKALVSAGSRWNEKTVGLAFGRGLAFFLLPIGGLLLWLAANMSTDKGAGMAGQTSIVLMLGLAFAIPGLLLMMRRSPSRSIVLGVDGSITTPDGLPGQPLLRKWEKLRTENIHSFAVAQSAPGFPDTQVNLITTSGDTIYLSRNLHSEHARKIVIQLTEALKEVRLAVEQPTREDVSSRVIN
jgi:hypothetical protein